MARTRRGSPPSYRLHKATGQAVVTLRDARGGRHDHYLGKHGSKESLEAYGLLLAEQGLSGAPVPSADGLTVAELMLRFLDHAEVYYRRPDGTQTSEVREYRRTIRAVRLLYGGTPAAQFSPLKLEAVRAAMVKGGFPRGVVNQRVGRVVRMWKWAAGKELAPAAAYQALTTVRGLAEGRSEARETDPVAPVEWRVVEGTLPFLNPSVRAMVRLQWLTGMRSEEVCRLRTRDLDRAGEVWLYRPDWHKTKRHGRRRVIGFGPQAQRVLGPFLRPHEPERVLFSPRDFPRGSWGKPRLPGE
jgi:integrase